MPVADQREVPSVNPIVDVCVGLTATLQSAYVAWQRATSAALADTHVSANVAAQVLLVSQMGSGVPQHELAERAGISPAGLVRLLDRAEEMGLLERRRVANDRRVRVIHLSPEGLALAARMERSLSDASTGLMQGLVIEDVLTTMKVLSLMEERARVFVKDPQRNSCA